MSGTEAVICTSGTTVGLYNVPAYDTPTLSSATYISNASCSQSTNTVVTFTRPLSDSGASTTLSTTSSVYHVAAVGSGNTMAQHQYRGTKQTVLTTPSPTMSPTT